jgi:hypothetical protein
MKTRGIEETVEELKVMFKAAKLYREKVEVE